MSTPLAIAATTLTLRNLLSEVATADYSALPADARPLNQIDITTQPPDHVRPDAARNRINLFLYHTEYNAAWRNTDLPRQGRPGEKLPPALPLNLHYLVTVYAENDNELIAQVLLGNAMRVLHDHPVLGPAEIEAALADAELDTQVERVRVTALPFTSQELSAIWSGFQSEYRLSAGYKVGVLLIESARHISAPLPVLRRGEVNRGPAIVSGGAPVLSRIESFVDPALPSPPVLAKPAAELGDTVVVKGSNFSGATMTARLTNDSDITHSLPLLPERDDSTVRFALPQITDADVARDWPAGFYRLEMEVTRTDAPSWATNRLTFALAPSVSNLAPASQPEAAQPFALTVTCTPQLQATQRVVVLLGDRALAPAPGAITTPADPNAPSTVTVDVDNLEPGQHVARLRIDGIDSLPVDAVAIPPTFDAAQMLTISP